MQLATGKHRFQEIACVHATFGLACADDSVQFVDEQKRSAFLFFDFVKDGFQPFFKLAAVLRARNQRTHIQRENLFVFQSFGDVAAYDTLCKPFNDCGLANARITDKHGVVFRLSGKNPYDVSYFLVTADYRVEFPSPCPFDKVVSVFIERFVSVFRIVRGVGRGFDFFQSVQKRRLVHAVRRKQFFEIRRLVVENTFKKMLDSDVCVAVFFGVLFGSGNDFRRFVTEIHARAFARNPRERFNHVFDRAFKTVGAYLQSC